LKLRWRAARPTVTVIVNTSFPSFAVFVGGDATTAQRGRRAKFVADPRPFDGRVTAARQWGVDEIPVRRSARAILVDDTDRVLLFRVADPVHQPKPMWITPGGAVEPAESLVDTVVREVEEETGLRLSPGDVGDPVAVCRGEWRYRGAPLRSEDWFFVVAVAPFTPINDGWTELERIVHQGWRWWTTPELDASAEPVVPAGIAELVGRHQRGDLTDVVELPWTAVGEDAPPAATNTC
jgi:8-oxo-dGTP pyrophosphatase MutT (NUDIX family)